MTKVLFANHAKALPEKTIQRIPCAVSPTPVSRCGVGLPAGLAAGRLRHEDVGAQRRLGRQGASVQVNNEDGRGHSEMMSDTFFGIFIPSPPVLVHATPFHLARIRVPRCLDVICAWPRDREEREYATRFTAVHKGGSSLLRARAQHR